MRQITLDKAACYRVRQSFGITAPRACFQRNQIVRFSKYIGYSHYDCASVYLFENVQTGEYQEFWFFDSDADTLIDEYFEPVPCAEK